MHKVISRHGHMLAHYCFVIISILGKDGINHTLWSFIVGISNTCYSLKDSSVKFM